MIHEYMLYLGDTWHRKSYAIDTWTHEVYGDITALEMYIAREGKRPF